MKEQFIYHEPEPKPPEPEVDPLVHVPWPMEGDSDQFAYENEHEVLEKE